MRQKPGIFRTWREPLLFLAWVVGVWVAAAAVGFALTAVVRCG